MANKYKLDPNLSASDVNGILLKLKQGLTTFDVTHNGEVLKTVLDELTGEYLGNLNIRLTRDGIAYSGVNITVRDDQNAVVNTITTNVNGDANFTLTAGKYSVEMGLLLGLQVVSYTVVDDDDSDNTLVGSTFFGIDVGTTAQASINTDVSDIQSPVLNSLTINNGDAVASNPNLTLNLDYDGTPLEYMVSKDPEFLGAEWQPYSGGNINYFYDYIDDTTAILYLKLKNTRGESESRSDSIDLQNGIVRSDSAKTYNSLSTAIQEVYDDYSGNLTQDVTISFIGDTINGREDYPYGIEMKGWNLNSDYLLTIDGANRFTFDCESLGGFRVKYSRNIYFKDINFINVGSETNSSSPDELSAIFIQGILGAECDNMIITGCTMDGFEIDRMGSYAVIAKYVNNITVIGNTVSNFDAHPIMIRDCGVINFVKNDVSGKQTRGIVSQPALMLLSGQYVRIADNILNGNVDPARRFDTTIEIKAPRIEIERNRFLGSNSDHLNISTDVPGAYLKIKSNVFRDGLLNPYYAYEYEKNEILISGDWNLVEFEHNTVKMTGRRLTEPYDFFFRTFESHINHFKTRNNVFLLQMDNFTDNKASARIYELESVDSIEADYNTYIDKLTIDPDNGYLSCANYLWVTGSESPIRIPYVKSIEEMQADFSLEINSQQIDLVNTPLNADLSIAAPYLDIILADGNNHVLDVDYKTINLKNSAGAIYHGGLLYDETTDTETGFTVENTISNDLIEENETMIANSGDPLLFKPKNTNRGLIGPITFLSAHHGFMKYGQICMLPLLSQLDGEGDYTGDSEYDITWFNNTVPDIVNVAQARPVANFKADNYFPFVGQSVQLTNLSEANDSDAWTINDGSNTTNPTTENVSLIILAAGDLNQTLQITNTVGTSSVVRRLYSTPDPDLEYFDIETTHEVSRVGEEVTISLNKFNTVSGATVTHSIEVRRHSDGTVVASSASDTLVYSYTETGIFDVVAVCMTNGTPVEQKKGMFLTVTPALQERSSAIEHVITPVGAPGSTYFYDALGYSVQPGSTVVMKLDPTADFDVDEFRVSFSGFKGTAQNPIVITIDEATQMEFNFNSYWGIQFYECEHVVFDGRGYQNLEYGIHVKKHDNQERAEIALTAGKLCTDVQVHSVEVSKATFAGMQAKTDPKADKPEYWRENYTFYNFILHHMYFHDTANEGIYIGYFNNGTLSGTNSQGQVVTYRPHALEDCKIYRNKFVNNGWDALQANNMTGNSEIAYNYIYNSAIYPERDQATMMSVGLTGAIHNNYMVGSGGIGIQYLPLGDLDIYNNVIDKVAYGQIAMQLMTSKSVPEMWDPTANGGEGIGVFTGEINIYNNTMFSRGVWMSAQNVVPINNVWFRNNLQKYEVADKDVYKNMPSDTLDQWKSQTFKSFRITDNGETFEVGDIDNEVYQISSHSNLAKGGDNYGDMYDIRGYKYFYDSGKFVGAYQGFRKQLSSVITLNSFTINDDDAITTLPDVNCQYSYDGVPTHYRISENNDFSGASWNSLVAPIPFTLSAGSGLKTVYLQLSNSNQTVLSNVMSDTITFNGDKSYKVDIGRNVFGYIPGDVYPTTEIWNQFTVADGVVPTTGITSDLLKDQNDIGSTIYLEVTQDFSSMNYQGGNAGDADDPNMIYPWEATRDQWYVDSPAVGEITIKGLDDAKTYDVRCFGSRSYTQYTTIYRVQGNAQPLDCKNNVANYVGFLGVSPVNGAITVQVEESEGKGTLNVLEIIEKG